MKPIRSIAIGAVVAVTAAGLSGCDQARSVVTAPPPPPPPITQGPSSGPPLPVKSIQIGDAVTGQLHSSDPGCVDLLDPMDTWTDVYPCQEYQVSVPAAGTLSMHVTWEKGTGHMCIGSHISTFPNYMRQCVVTPPLDVSARVASGTYAFGVEFHGGAADANNSYSLTTAFSAGASAAAR